jgi:hypothetical protein
LGVLITASEKSMKVHSAGVRRTTHRTDFFMHKLVTTLGFAGASLALSTLPASAAGVATPNPVAPGATFSYSASGCGADGQTVPQVVQIRPTNATLFDNNSPSVQFPASGTVTLTAPTTPGTYAVLAYTFNSFLPLSSCSVQLVVATNTDVPAVKPIVGIAAAGAVGTGLLVMRRRRIRSN